VRYAEFRERDHFTKDDLLASAWGRLVEDVPEGGIPTLPAPPMLMFDRIVEVTHRGTQGRIVAEQDVVLDAWYFQCHFRNDPVQPGCLGVDAVWQLIGFYMAVRGAKGAGRALGSKEVEFFGQIRPHDRVVRYEIDIRRYAELPATGSAVAIGNASVLVDGQAVYRIQDAKVGVFLGIRYEDYPQKSDNATGGQIRR
jgi:3-hydroxyacyl-[acyl-carrier protein] dehydratase/trans-2-decenoyl-[acyl-carrier protein] isomerase